MSGDLIGELCKGIYDLYSADTLLKSAITSLHQEEALQDTAVPYGTFTLADINPDRKLGSHNEIATIEFALYTRLRSERATAWDELDRVYNDSNLTLPGYGTVYILWESMYMMDSGIENVWKVVGRYRAYLTEL